MWVRGEEGKLQRTREGEETYGRWNVDKGEGDKKKQEVSVLI